MIGESNPSLNVPADLYTANNEAIAAAMSRIASSRRAAAPGDDFAGFAHAQSLQSDLDNYQGIRKNLQDANGFADYAAGVGNDITGADFNRLKELKDLYTSASDDPARQASYAAEYAATVGTIAGLKSNSFYDGVKVYQAGTVLQSVKAGPANESTAINIAASSVGNEAAVADIAGTSDAAIQSEINNSQTYATEMQSLGALLRRTMIWSIPRTPAGKQRSPSLPTSATARKRRT